jgi:TetR/AcrR family transcriptional regulator, transcriptional repressor for nem operon
VVATSRGKIVLQKLLEYGAEIFSKRSYSSVGMSEIIKGAGLAKGSFYNYFKSKDEYAASVIQHYTHVKVDTFLVARSDSKGNGAEIIAAWLEHARAEGELHNYNKGCLLSTQCAQLTTLPDTYTAALKASLTVLRDCLEGALRNKISTDPMGYRMREQQVASLLLSAYLGASMRMRIEKSSYPMIVLQEFLKDMASRAS